MSEVFRLFKDGADTIKGWNGSNNFPYISSNRDKIEDPDGAKASMEITSIPTPFARIDIAGNSFKEVCKKGLDGETIYHKTVSDVLDIGQLFFNIDLFKKNFKIISWSKKQIETLMNSNFPEHNRLGNSLKVCWESDSKAYNFEYVKNIYILVYTGRGLMDVVGATSPLTLFFSTANDLSFLQGKIVFPNNDKPFDNNYMPLYKRDPEYIKAWFMFIEKLKKSDLNVRLDEIEDYLRDTQVKLAETNQVLAKEISQIQENIDGQEDNPITIDGNNMELFDVIFQKKKIRVVSGSDFEITPDYNVEDKVLPLVLPDSDGNLYKNFEYVNGKWGNENKAPSFDPRPLEKRTLPCNNTPQPYLTRDDFLSDILVKVNNKFNSTDFILMKGSDKESEETYLMPLKDIYFKYFSPSSLKENIEIEELACGKKVILRIPVKGLAGKKYVEFSKTYIDTSSETTEGSRIEEMKFDGIVMPLIRCEGVSPKYTVALIAPSENKIEFNFYSTDKKINSKATVRQTPDIEIHTKSYSVYQNFDFIRVIDRVNDISAIVVPKFKVRKGTKKFKVAVDVGTSNTHVEISNMNNGMNTETLEFAESEVMSRMFNYNKFQKYIEDNFLPLEVGRSSNRHIEFPTRTVLSYSESNGGYSRKKENIPFESFNNSLVYDKLPIVTYNQYETDIKWAGNDNRFLQDYINCLARMIRDKLLCLDADIKETELVWFYPTSMPTYDRDNMESLWKDAYIKYFEGSKDNVMKITEACSPVEYVFNRENNSHGIINIDIGGGTTDIAFAHDTKVEFTTSFRFATNSLFEDQLSPKKSNKDNGIINYYKERIKNELKEKPKIIELMETNDSHSNPANMASFLFSLKDHPDLKEISSSIKDFNKLLRNDGKFKIVFLLYYTAIIYHVARIMKEKKFENLTHISFSGNGSKIILAITDNIKLIEEFTSEIIEQVSGCELNSGLSIFGLDSDVDAKKLTCIGGINTNIENLKEVSDLMLGCRKMYDISKVEYTYGEIGNDKKIIDEMTHACEDFFEIAFQFIKKYLMNKKFYVDEKIIKLTETWFDNNQNKKGIRDSIEREIRLKKQEKVSESLFFIPIKRILNDLSLMIDKELSNNKQIR